MSDTTRELEPVGNVAWRKPGAPTGIAQIAQYLVDGSRARRAAWPLGQYIFQSNGDLFINRYVPLVGVAISGFSPCIEDLMASDWELSTTRPPAKES